MTYVFNEFILWSFLFMQITTGDLDIAARTVYGEARGEDLRGKTAVALVLINRVQARQNDKRFSLAAVATEWLQFSAWRESDPNFEHMMTVGLEDEVFQECMLAVLQALVLDNNGEDFTNGSTHYHTKDISPYWASNRRPVYEHGNHFFYNDVR